MISTRSTLIRDAAGGTRVYRPAVIVGRFGTLRYTVPRGAAMCRLCGCVEPAACLEGCGWADSRKRLCTRCAGAAGFYAAAIENETMNSRGGYMATLEEIRARWAALDWHYYHQQIGESYIAEARLDQLQPDGSTLTLLDLDEPSADECKLLDRVALAPGDVRALLELLEAAEKARHAAIERARHAVERGRRYEGLYVRLAVVARMSVNGPSAYYDERLIELLNAGAEAARPLLDLLDAAHAWARAIREVDGVAAAEQQLLDAIDKESA